MDMKQKGYESCYLIHDTDLGFSRLDYKNNYQRITSDITSAQGKTFSPGWR